LFKGAFGYYLFQALEQLRQCNAKGAIRLESAFCHLLTSASNFEIISARGRLIPHSFEYKFRKSDNAMIGATMRQAMDKVFYRPSTRGIVVA
jgi:hypothetical protein